MQETQYFIYLFIYLLLCHSEMKHDAAKCMISWFFWVKTRDSWVFD